MGSPTRPQNQQRPTCCNRSALALPRYLLLTLALCLGSVPVLGDEPATASDSTQAATTDSQTDASSTAGQAAQQEADQEMHSGMADSCPDTHLRKSLTITAFNRLNPSDANAGNLFQIERGLPVMFRRQMSETQSGDQIVTPRLMMNGLAVPSVTENELRQQVREIAQHMGTQFVLRGFISDMSMEHPESTYAPSLYRQAVNGLRDLTHIHFWDKRNRRLELTLELRDGFTGDPLFIRTYTADGAWNTRRNTGFNSAEFRNTPYGQSIVKLVEQASKDLQRTIACQPYIAALDLRPGAVQVQLMGGANNGLHAGDQLDVYQLINVPSNTEYMAAETRMVKRNTRLQLNEVYPSHSTATLIDGPYLNGAFLAVSD